VSPLPSRYVLFTDLDGTLLDHQTYSWAGAREALAELEQRGVPLVFCTSKTRSEVEMLRRKVRNAHPFITENGGGVFIPQGYFPRRIPGETRVGRYHCLALGRPYEDVVEAMQAIAKQAGADVVGFHQMTAHEVADNTGLTLAEAELARKRDFDEPFFFAGGNAKAEATFLQAARQRGLEVTRGGRFWHLFSGSDKGKAVRRLFDLYRQGAHHKLRSVALGDSANDLPLLAAADQAFLLPRPDGSFDAEVLEKLPRVARGAAPGSQGWNAAVLGLFPS